MKTVTAMLMGLSMLACNGIDNPLSRGNQISASQTPSATTTTNSCDGSSTAGLVPTTSAMPALHEIHQATFTRPYSCTSGGYQESALFLSQRAQQENSPDLLYNGACGSTDYLEASTAGDDFSLIADLGAVPLESLTASMSFNYQGVVGYDNVFRADADVVQGHTYVVLIAKADHRALFALNVATQAPDCGMTIRYAVLSYSFLTVESQSDGFDWGSTNQ